MIVLKKNENLICFILFKYKHYRAYLTMVKRTLVIGEGAPIYALGMGVDGKPVITNNPPTVDNQLYVLSEGGKYVYSGIVLSVSRPSKCKFGYIPSLNLFIPHNSSPVNPHLEVVMAFSEAVTVTVEFENPEEQVICICGVNVRLSKAMDA